MLKMYNKLSPNIIFSDTVHGANRSVFAVSRAKKCTGYRSWQFA